MNYIKPNEAGVQLLFLNTREDAAANMSWTITEEGNNDPTATFSTNTAFAILSEGNYYQALSISLNELGIALKEETSYILKAVNDAGDVVYRGKLYSTSQNKENYKVNDDNFTAPDLTNEFIILE